MLVFFKQNKLQRTLEEHSSDQSYSVHKCHSTLILSVTLHYVHPLFMPSSATPLQLATLFFSFWEESMLCLIHHFVRLHYLSSHADTCYLHSSCFAYSSYINLHSTLLNNCIAPIWTHWHLLLCSPQDHMTSHLYCPTYNVEDCCNRKAVKVQQKFI